MDYGTIERTDIHVHTRNDVAPVEYRVKVEGVAIPGEFKKFRGDSPTGAEESW